VKCEGDARRQQEHIAVAEAMLAQALALHMEAIGAAKVQNAPFARCETYLRMLTRDLRVAEHDVVVREPPYPQVVAVKRDTANVLPDANFQIGHRALQRSTSPTLLIPLDTVVGMCGATGLRRRAITQPV
jgi:hypothetical protein